MSPLSALSALSAVDTPASNDHRTRSRVPIAIAALLFGIAINLVVNGYQFGLSNHSVYLIDALRKSDPSLLANDWFYTKTLQYHSVFGWLTATLLKLGILQPAFAAIYAILLAVFHVSWRSIVIRLGGDDRAYLLSVVLYFSSAGGIGLGTYQFFQDSAVLASNVANVALFAGVAAFVAGRWIPCGIAMAAAALFHLNHAAVVVMLWTVFSFFDNRFTLHRWFRPTFVIASILVVAACAANILPAAGAKLGHSGSIPLPDFVDLYARLRHPHHYDPSSWSFAIWLAFCIWIPPAIAWMWIRRRELQHCHPERTREGSRSIVEAGEILREYAQDDNARVVVALLVIMSLQILALSFAGILYVSETLVQMSLFRFSIIPHVLLVIFSSLLIARWKAAAWVLPSFLFAAAILLLLSPVPQLARERIGSIAAMIVLAATPALIGIWRERPFALVAAAVVTLTVIVVSGPRLTGLSRPLVKIDADYLALCAWARDESNTPPDAVFLTPPTDEEFRWFARRAIVVNWKSVTQLSGELPEWRDRMSASLGWPNLDALPRGSYIRAIEAMRTRYDDLGGQPLFTAARRYGARYVVATHPLGDEYARYRAGPPFGRYLLYDLSR